MGEGMNQKKIISQKVKRKTTIHDVAKLAGVSPGTVSRTLNSVGYINKATKNKVIEAVNTLGYIPNRAGRTLKTTKTGLIMLAIPDTSNEVYFGMIESVLAVAKSNGYSLVLYYTDGQHEEEVHAVRLLRERVIDGLFLIHFSYAEELRNEICSAIGPIVLCGMCNNLWAGDDNAFDTISIDVYKGIYDSVVHLIQMGHRKIAYLAGKRGIEVYKQRFNAYLDALRDNGIEYKENIVFWDNYTEMSGYSAGRAIFQAKDRPTAICASNDLQAIGCWRAAKDLGGNIPEDIALIGIDNLSICRILGISSMNMHEAEVGEIAAKLLFTRMSESTSEKLPSQNYYFRPELVARGSSLARIIHM